MIADPHPSSAEIASLGVAALTRALAEGSLSSAEVTDVLLERIAALDPPGSPVELRSVLAPSGCARDEARGRDRERRQGEDLGPLHGVPVLVKDNVEVEGLPSTSGSTALSGRPPASDAPLVGRLRAAGAVILGTTNLSQWANIRSPRSTSGWSAVGGLTANPWALDRSPGGSSSGSGAALAAGLAPLAVGTETDGSITCPASVNGVAGIKPTVGTVPTDGVVPISHSQDSPGPMARSVDDVALLLEVLNGAAGARARAAAGITGLRVAVASTWRTGHPATDAAFDGALAHLQAAGATVAVVQADVPGPREEHDELTVMLCELFDGLNAYLPTRGAEGPQSLEQVIAFEQDHSDVELAHFGHELFEQAQALGGQDTNAYRGARRRNLSWALNTCLRPALAHADVLVAPSYGPAWKSDLVVGGHGGVAHSPVSMAPAIAGWPIATVPMALVDGLPVGMSLVGPPGSEGTLLAAAQAVEDGAGLLAGGRLRPAWRPAQGG